MARKSRKTAKKAAPKAKKASRSRRLSNRAAGQLMASTGGGWGPKEQALSWALQIPRGQTDARQVIADAKHFEEYLSGGALRK